MRRRAFLQSLSLGMLAPMIGTHELASILDDFPKTERMPAIFVGHGSPLNALADNTFTRSLASLGKSVPAPRAIFVVSAHWMTKGTAVAVTAKPQTIYDFYGFPEKMYSITYPCDGAPKLARSVASTVKSVRIAEDAEYGIDHGAWTMLKHLFPAADVPVFQLSIDVTQPMQHHYDLARELRPFRNRGVLILGSGNIVHNLRRVDWENENARPFDWAEEFDETVKASIVSRDHEKLIRYESLGASARAAVPTNDHYIPMLYPLSLQEKDEEASFTFEGFQHGSVSMRCFRIG